MEQVAIWRRMAEKWREAADEVAEPALRSCYVQRAVTYERLVTRGNRGPAGTQPSNHATAKSRPKQV